MVIAAELILILLWLRAAIGCVLVMAARLRHTRLAPTFQVAASRVSIVVPAYNEAETIEATLAALKQLDPPPLEVIVVDDGSCDATAAIARRCLSGIAGAIVISLPANMGKAAALNTGVGVADGELIATIDADTRLAPDALGAALATMERRGAAAVAFDLDVANRANLIGQLQRQEYVAVLLFERAGQDVIGAISILPGAATLFRKDLLTKWPFSGRTRTEDADLTLQLARRRVPLAVAADAAASTVTPATWSELAAQRERWLAGHLQCLAVHARELRGASALFRFLVLPNFALSTVMTVPTLVALLTLAVARDGPLLGLGWLGAALLTLVLAYGQRGCVWLIEAARRPSLFVFLVEPHVTNVLTLYAFGRAVLSLAADAARTRHASVPKQGRSRSSGLPTVGEGSSHRSEASANEVTGRVAAKQQRTRH